MTSIPASSSSSTSCQRFSLREPGTFECASSSISATSGALARIGVDVHLLEARAPVLDRSPGNDLEVAQALAGLGTAVRLDEPDHHVRPRSRRRMPSPSMANVLPTPAAYPR